MKWYHWLLRPLLNWWGTLSGFSGCGICGDRWNWKKPHEVAFAQGISAFPTCEECWQSAQLEEIVRAARKLGDKWIEYASISRRYASRMIAAVEKAAKKRCNFCPVGPQRKGIVPAACVGCARKEIEKGKEA